MEKARFGLQISKNVIKKESERAINRQEVLSSSWMVKDCAYGMEKDVFMRSLPPFYLLETM